MLQTILGSSGQIGTELTRELARNFTRELRLVSRNPVKVNEGDETFAADLLDPEQTLRAVEGSKIVYLTAGLPMDTAMWVEQWPIMMRNVIEACEVHGAKLVFFDNTYMYPQTATPQTEETEFQPQGQKGEVRAKIVRMLETAIEEGRVEALIGRAPEFYGPGKTRSVTTTMVVDNLWNGNPAKVLLRDDTKRTLIYTPDASRALALLGNTPDAYGQTWHLPSDDDRVTLRKFVDIAADTFETEPRLDILKKWQLKLASLFSKRAAGAVELLPRYAVDNIFVSDKFKARFPEFQVTSIASGLEEIRRERAGAEW